MAVVGEWQRGSVIGRGASATVSIATDHLTGDVFAVKSAGMALAGVLRHEHSVLSALSSPYVVFCIGADVSKAADGSGAACYDLFLELAPGGSLVDETKRCGGRCGEPLIRSRVGDVLRGLVYVHGSGIAHCDVKGRNVLVGADGRAKLADFGCARWTAEVGGNARGATIRGTPMFLAPEAARGEAQGTAADIWALGCTVIEMATGGMPWPRFADPVAVLHHVAHSGDVPESPEWFSEEGKDFLARCLIRDPAERWTAEQLLEHPFVALAASSPASPQVSKAVSMEQWVSPKSILDQVFWEHSSSMDSDSTAVVTPADRLRALASVDAPDWTWSCEDWITVCSLPETNVAPLSPNSDADTTEDAAISDDEDDVSSSDLFAGERTGVDAPRGGDGPSHGHNRGCSAGHDGASPSCTTPLWRGDSAITTCTSSNFFCNSGITSNERCHWLIIKSANSRPSGHWCVCSWCDCPFSFSLFPTFTSFSSRDRREP